jgi:hypothetical protein
MLLRNGLLGRSGNRNPSAKSPLSDHPVGTAAAILARSRSKTISLRAWARRGRHHRCVVVVHWSGRSFQITIAYVPILKPPSHRRGNQLAGPMRALFGDHDHPAGALA